MAWLHRARRWVATLLVAVLLGVGAGCYGSFPLTHLVYSVNGQIEPGLLEQVTFWVFLILPVYEISALGDIVILNLLEFWTGAEFEGFEESATEDGLEFAMEPGGGGRTALVTVSREGKTVARARFVRVSEDLCEVRSPEGQLLGRAVRSGDGELRLEAADGRAVAGLSAAEFDRLTASSPEPD